MVRRTHDPVFKYLFGEPEHAAALLRHSLPDRIVARLDLDTMTPICVRGSARSHPPSRGPS